jgi:hypothetical protein
MSGLGPGEHRVFTVRNNDAQIPVVRKESYGRRL